MSHTRINPQVRSAGSRLEPLEVCDDQLEALSQELEALEIAVFCLESRRRELDQRWAAMLYERDRIADRFTGSANDVGT